MTFYRLLLLVGTGALLLVGVGLPVLFSVQASTLRQDTPVPTSTPIVSLFEVVTDEQLEALINGSEDCGLPCWWGIRVNETTVSEAEQILAPLGVPLAYYDFYPTLKSYELQLQEFTLRFDLLEVNGVFDDVIERLVVNVHSSLASEYPTWQQYTAQWVMRQLGVPDRAYLQSAFNMPRDLNDLFNMPLDPNDLMYYDLYLAYNPRYYFRAFFRTSVQPESTACLDRIPYDEFTFWINRPDKPLASNVDVLAGMFPTDSYTLENGWDISRTEFTNIILDDDNCFEIEGITASDIENWRNTL